MTVVKPDNEERRVAMFKDNKLRLLMVLVGFSRIGADNDPEASWIIPSSLKTSDLLEAVDLIRKFEFDPPTYEDGKTAQDFLRSKAAAARTSARKVDYDDDSDGIDHGSEEDRGEYAPDGPTARQSSKKILKRRRRQRTPRELDDEEKDRRAEDRRQKELEKQRKVKSTVFVHDSDDEDDPDRDEEFFLREQALRESTSAQFRRTLALGSTEPASSRKRKSDGQGSNEKKRRKSPPKRRTGPFDTDESDAEDDDAGILSSRASSHEVDNIIGTGSEQDEEDTTETPLSSQHAAAHNSDNEHGLPGSLTITAKGQDTEMADVDDEDEEDTVPTVRRRATRTLRAGFIVDSDSE